MVWIWWEVLFVETDRIVEELFKLVNSVEQNTPAQENIDEKKDDDENVVEIEQQANVGVEEEYNPSATYIQEERKEEEELDENTNNKVVLIPPNHRLVQTKPNPIPL